MSATFEQRLSVAHAMAQGMDEFDSSFDVDSYARRERAARRGGYFWLPCPTCRNYFGGNEWQRVDGHAMSVPNGTRGGGTGICPDCVRLGIGCKVRADLGMRSDHVVRQVGPSSYISGECPLYPSPPPPPPFDPVAEGQRIARDVFERAS